jgi:hypothetical protein
MWPKGHDKMKRPLSLQLLKPSLSLPTLHLPKVEVGRNDFSLEDKEVRAQK